MHQLNIRDKIRLNAEARGDLGRTWLAQLPEIIREQERLWRIIVGRAVDGGTESYVAQTRTEDGRDAMLKIVIPGNDPTRQELRTLQAADGRGYARLIRSDATNNILLLERLGPNLHASGRSEDEILAIICATLREAWMPQPDGPPFATGAAKAEELAATITRLQAQLSGPCPQRAVDRALDFAESRRRAFDPALSVLAHGDAHEWNTLSVPATSQFKFVDPDGAFAERAYDLAVPMREWGPAIPPGDLLALGRRRAALLSRLSGIEEHPIWEWSLIQCVWNGLLLKEIGDDDGAAVEFAMADAWTV
ncbi:MAG TPA: aminoglycoside phosphotransferase family protein [Rhizomicrobium sp.]|nr:aminoglycoside phosphotransferase family protein [Rhizomicrobium sp.]